VIHVALWLASAFFLVWLFLAALSSLIRLNERRALRRLRKAHAELSPEQKSSRVAQRVEWYFNLPEDQQTQEKWEWVQSSDKDVNET
jgi:hypothetical protein